MTDVRKQFESEPVKELELVKEPETNAFVLEPLPEKKARRYHPVWDFLTKLFYIGVVAFFIYWFGWPWFLDRMKIKVSEVVCDDVCLYDPEVSTNSVDSFSYLGYSIPIVNA